MNLPFLLDAAILAMLQGALVALPRPRTLEGAERLRSPWWALLLPAIIVVGTFTPLLVPAAGLGFALLAAAAAPFLVALSLFGILRGPRLALALLAVALGIGVITLHGWPGELADSAATALECLAIGVVVTRMIPGRALLVGVLAMAAVDVLLLATGVSQIASAATSSAASQYPGPTFDQAHLGPVSVGFPDLTLTAMLGAYAARDFRRQLRTAGTLTVMVIAYALLLPYLKVLPATVPIALAFCDLAIVRARAARRLSDRRRPRRPAAAHQRSTATRSRGRAAPDRVRPAPASAG